MIRRTITAAVVLPLLLAACSSGGGGSASDVDYTSAKAIAAAIDKGGYTCTGFAASEVMGARENGTCDHSGTSVTVSTYTDADTMAQINKAFAPMMSGVYVAGDKWQVNLPDKEQATAVQKIIGGDVK